LSLAINYVINYYYNRLQYNTGHNSLVRGVGSVRRLGEQAVAGVWGRSPQRGPGQSPWWRIRPPWSWKLFGSWTSHGAAKLDPLSVFSSVQ